MKDITQYINEGIVDMLMKVFAGKLKMLRKKFNISENSVSNLSEKFAEIQDTLNNELKELSKGKIVDSDKWWKQLTKVKPEVAKVVSPIAVNNSIIKNLLNIPGVYKKALESWEDVKILDTPGIQYHIKRDITQLVVLTENIIKDNSKLSNINQQLKRIEALLEQLNLKDKEAKRILDETLDIISDKTYDIFKKDKITF